MTSLTFDIYLRSTPERVPAVLTDPGNVAEDETGSESARGRRLTCEWLQTEHLTANGGHPSVVSFEFTAMGEVTRVATARLCLSRRAQLAVSVSAAVRAASAVRRRKLVRSWRSLSSYPAQIWSIAVFMPESTR